MGDTMQGLVEEDLFKLMDDFSINDASCLIAGISPHKYYFEDQYGEWGFREINNSDPDNIREAVELVKKSLCNAIKKGKLKATVVVDNYNTKFLTKIDMQADWFLTHELDVTRTTIEKVDLIEWLKNRAVYPKIFFPQGKIVDISNQVHPLYSAKLHAVVSAWKSLFTADIQSTTTKRYLTDWLTNHSEKFSLGIKSSTKFEEMAEIANFDKRGVTVVGDPLHHFGGDEYKNEITNESTSLNENIFANISDSQDQAISEDLPF